MLSLAEWDQRYRQQAGWTKALRSYIFRHLALEADSRVLEIGCGTGAILDFVYDYTQLDVFGIDLHIDGLQFARHRNPTFQLANADAHALPFASHSFTAVFCHFVLLWLAHPQLALQEMLRVTQPNGAVIVFAEPDYGGRIDYPAEIKQLGEGQVEALKAQGADPFAGRKIRAWLQEAGLTQIHAGVLGAEWSGAPDLAEVEAEWIVLAADIGSQYSTRELDEQKAAYLAARSSLGSVVYVPTFFAWGRVKPG